MRRRSSLVLLTVALFGWPAAASAETKAESESSPGSIVTDRPTDSASPILVPHQTFQLEAGYKLSRFDQGELHTYARVFPDLPPPLWGNRKVEARLVAAGWSFELREVGAQILDFHTRKGPGNRFQINFRNHRKIVVVDGHTARVGGHNVGDEYRGRDPEFGHWRDTHVRITGPAALAVQLTFFEDWYWATGKTPEFGWAPHLPGGEGKDVLILPTGPADRLESASLMFLSGINLASERIWIASPYFVPDESLMNALHLAALRGVDVRIIIPDKADHTLVWLAAYSYFEEASETGIRFFRYMDGFLHQKVVLVDDNMSAVGTANFDNRSFRLNFEIMAIVADEAFATEVEQMLLADMEKSVEMQPGDLDKKSFWFKLGTRLARLAAPVQ